MKNIVIFPNLDNLKSYFDYTPEKIARIKEFGISIGTDYGNFDYYYHVVNEFKNLANTYDITENCDDLTWLIIYFNEHMFDYIETLKQNHKDDIISKEVADFLLAIKRNETVGKIEIAIKDDNGTHKIKNDAVSRWMCNLIMETIETGNIPYEIFGEKFFYNFYGVEPDFSRKINIEMLEETAKMKIEKPSKFKNRVITKFYKYLKPYLDEHTRLATPSQFVLTNIQAEFYFDLFNMLGHIDARDTKLTKAKFMRTIFNNSNAFDDTE